MGQYIIIYSENAEVPEGVKIWTNHTSIVDDGRGQYIKVGLASFMPDGASWRGGGYAEVTKTRGEYIFVGALCNVPKRAQWRENGWAEKDLIIEFEAYESFRDN